MDIVYTLEDSSLSLFINESIWAYPALISTHALGMGVFSGIAVISHLWCLGFFTGMQASAFKSIYRVAWVGLCFNFISGVLMFFPQASLFIGNTAFLLKIACLVIAVVLSALLFRRLKSASETDLAPLFDFAMRARSSLAIVLFLAVVVSGRLIAYTGDFA